MGVSRVLAVVAAVSVCVLGCGNDAPPTANAPPMEEVHCVDDTDCSAVSLDACEQVHCSAEGTCEGVAKAEGSTCRASAGGCDVEETCDGTSTTCPDDAIAEAGTTCRDAVHDCDVIEECDGSAPECPEDASADVALCDDNNPCTNETCDSSTGCMSEPVEDETPCGDTSSCVEGDCVSDMALFGQENFYGIFPNGAPVTKSSLLYPGGIAMVGSQFAVAELGTNRVGLFDNFADGAVVALGQSSLEVGLPNFNVGAPNAAGLQTPTGVCSDGTNVAVVDAFNHRVLLWNQVPTNSGVDADAVLGQSDFLSAEANQGNDDPGADTLNRPRRCVFTGTKLLVTDQLNNRVLVFDPVPTTNGASASLVIGQPDFASSEPNRGGAASALTLNQPIGIGTNGVSLFIADTSNNRVVVWDSIPTVVDQLATSVLGQSEFDATGAGATASGMNAPRAVAVGGTALFVADGANHRVLRFEATTIESGVDATAVLGHDDFDGTAANDGESSPAADTMRFPNDLVSDGTSLWVADTGNNRVLEWSTLPTEPTDSDAVYGQVDATSALPNGKPIDGSGVDSPRGLCVSDQYVVSPIRTVATWCSTKSNPGLLRSR